MSRLDLFGDVSTADTGERSDNDFYETAAWQTRSLIVNHPPIQGALVLECASGRDAIANVLRDEADCRVLTNDIDPAMPATWHLDATTGELWTRAAAMMEEGRRIEWVVSNFPFDVAFPILQYALAHVPNVAVLLRKTFTEPTAGRKVRGAWIDGRGKWLNQFPPTRIIGLPRHSYRGDSTDSVPHDWHIWERLPDRTLPPIVIDHLAKTRTRRLA